MAAILTFKKSANPVYWKIFSSRELLCCVDHSSQTKISHESLIAIIPEGKVHADR